MADQPHQVGIALGSNLGDRLGNLRTARDLLAAIAVPEAPVLQAPVYRTEPVDCPQDSPDFFNTVIEITYAGSPSGLLELTQSFQRKLGRPDVHERNGPRTIDIDLLYFGQERIRTESLELPHPRLTQRRFVLEPLAAIRPDLVLPGDVPDIAAHLAAIEEEQPALPVAHPTW